MKILINALILSNTNTGLGNYTLSLIENIFDKLSQNNEISFLCCKKEYLPTRFWDMCIEIGEKNFFGKNKFLNTFDYSKYDLFWSTTQHGAYNISCKQVITIHDLTPLIYPKGRLHQFLYYKFILPRVIKKSSYVLTVSNNTKNDILKYYKIDSSKIINAYESIMDEKLYFENVSPLPQFVMVGVHYPYKNLDLVIDAYIKYDDLKKYKVLIIGNSECKYAKIIKKKIKKNKLDNYICFTGYLSKKEKNDILRTSLALIYPSKYEGFGLPILESMSLGLPVICSNCSSLPEIAGDAALMINPKSVDDLKNKMIMINDDKIRSNLIKLGYENTKRFSWKNTSEVIEKLIEKMR